jgi:glycosyltransferase involved in cell wall biosynthesis
MRARSLLIISPVRNEADHIRLVARAMAAQTRPPDEWLVVDDHSSDVTLEILHELAGEIPFMRVLSAPADGLPTGADRLALAAAPRVFNFGLAQAVTAGWSYVGKLDGDIELPPDYFERLLAQFDALPRLGIGGGTLTELHRGEWQAHGTSHLEHVRGALKLYSRDCFGAIGGVRELLGWDGIDEVLARMHGFVTRSFPELVARHHRHTGSAQGRLRGHFRWGRCMYIEGYPGVWIAARSLKVAASRPRVVSGVAYLGGYLHAPLRGVRRFDEDGYRRHLRGELRRRARAKLAPAQSP